MNMFTFEMEMLAVMLIFVVYNMIAVGLLLTMPTSIVMPLSAVVISLFMVVLIIMGMKGMYMGMLVTSLLHKFIMLVIIILSSRAATNINHIIATILVLIILTTFISAELLCAHHIYADELEHTNEPVQG